MREEFRVKGGGGGQSPGTHHTKQKRSPQCRAGHRSSSTVGHDTHRRMPESVASRNPVGCHPLITEYLRSSETGEERKVSN